MQEIIGKGSYGTVCAAVDNLTGEKVAIKRIQNVFDNVADATRILREIILLRLLKHPDVVEVKHIMLPPDPRNFKDVYVVFELLESDLHTVIGANDDLTADHHKVFLYQLLRGLTFVHERGVLHRDLKPKNILANSNCKLKICDFGLARPFLGGETLTAWTDYVATRWYRAPELCGCFYGCYSQAVDIWSIGCMFAETLLGKPLFPGRDAVSQLHLITDLVGKPPAAVISRISNQKARNFLHELPNKPPRQFEHKFRNADPQALDLLKQLLAFDPSDRPTAAQALEHPYFKGLPTVASADCPPISSQQFEFEQHQLTEQDVRNLIYIEVGSDGWGECQLELGRDGWRGGVRLLVWCGRRGEACEGKGGWGVEALLLEGPIPISSQKALFLTAPSLPSRCCRRSTTTPMCWPSTVLAAVACPCRCTSTMPTWTTSRGSSSWCVPGACQQLRQQRGEEGYSQPGQLLRGCVRGPGEGCCWIRLVEERHGLLTPVHSVLCDNDAFCCRSRIGATLTTRPAAITLPGRGSLAPRRPCSRLPLACSPPGPCSSSCTPTGRGTLCSSSSSRRTTATTTRPRTTTTSLQRRRTQRGSTRRQWQRRRRGATPTLHRRTTPFLRPLPASTMRTPALTPAATFWPRSADATAPPLREALQRHHDQQMMMTQYQRDEQQQDSNSDSGGSSSRR